MSLADLIYRPFENLIRPLDIAYRPMPSSGPFALVWHFLRMFWPPLVAFTVLLVLGETFNLALIWGIAKVIDGVGAMGAAVFLRAHWDMLVLFGLMLFPAYPLTIFLADAIFYQSLAIGMPVAMQWQGHKAVERQDLGFFQDQFAGQVAARIGQVSQAVQQQMMVAAQKVPRFIMQFGGALVLLTAFAWPLVLPVLVWMIVVAVIVVRAVPSFTERSKRVAAARSRISGTLTDLYTNMGMVKQFAAEESEAGALGKVMLKSIATRQQENRLYVTTVVSLVTCNLLFLWIGMFAVGLYCLVNGYASLGDFVAGVTVAQRLAGNAVGLMEIGQQVFQAAGTIRDALPVITAKPTIVDVEDAPPLTVTAGEIRFERVSFSYHADRRVIRHLDLTIRPGEKLGLVGVSGAGKSTVVSLLLRFFDVSAGRILIDGQDIRQVRQTSLRERVGVIAQDVSLLHRSVGDNIRYGRPGARRAEVERAAEMAQADGFIAELVDAEGRSGYDAYVGDRGVKLSGGQRQRVAIARVLLKDAPILVLDEATSALDSEAEAAIQEKLDVLMQGKTVIAIAHRLSTIAQMDRIVVIDKGAIVEEGTPAELLERGGLYARLWARQTGGYIADAAEDDAAVSAAGG
ncbi:ABC transporter ATP-binding protein [Rhizobium halophytocola]|uniref:ATP-binding cassette subfamily B protein/ATP-binding cassette subfamily B multidrug efflux pump n=1 Tax=Rhizobium halophytocola TaxID=735519 RepID=A0ABS4E6I5_9HYPH|nr:ABC transporter ATP-binding protein [Rhizobium halophytocola]MBP1853536.1 ATP-binding cassette subfamily B protein/ATP-binding cassette subfamily B multidrug efflux pump [Rhizobium halophytocola]